MKFLKTKTFKIIRNIAIVFLVIYLILFILRIDTSTGTITEINMDTGGVHVTIDEKPFVFDVNDTLVLNENNTSIPFNELEVEDNIFIINYDWNGWVYPSIGNYPPLLYNVWLVKITS